MQFDLGNKQTWFTYADNYQKAALKVFEEMSNNGWSSESMGYSCLFLYRHTMELWIKIFAKFNRVYNNNTNLNINSHKLDDLWKEAQSFLQVMVTEIVTNQQNFVPGLQARLSTELQQIKNGVIHYLNDKDHGSFSFRYPTTNTGEPSLIGVTAIDLKKYANDFNTAAANFSAIYLYAKKYHWTPTQLAALQSDLLL